MKRLPSAARGQAKGLAPLLELLEGALHGSGIGGTKPGAEGQRPLGRGVLADDGGIALEARLAVASVPAHEQLPLRAHEQGGEVVGAAQGRELVAQPALRSAPARRRSRISSREVVVEKATRPMKRPK